MSKTTKLIAVSLGALININLAFADGCASKLDKANDGWDELVTCIRQIELENEKLRGGVSIPSGAVMAFDVKEGCTTGWTPYINGWGRFLIGAVSPDDIKKIPGEFVRDARGVDLTPKPFGGPNGEEMHLLTEAEMPRHKHVSEIATKSGESALGEAPPLANTINGASRGGFPPIYTSEMGGSVAHNNMPPYIALYFCKKD